MEGFKRFLTTIFIFALAVTLLPVTVLAAGRVHEARTAGELSSALANADSGDTIRLMDNIIYPEGITVNGIDITFDLNDCTLNVANPSGTGLEVAAGGNVILTGEGGLNVSGTGIGVYVQAGGSAAVTSAAAEGMNCIGAFAEGAGAVITVGGDAAATGQSSCGVSAAAGGTVEVGGSASADGYQCYGAFTGGGAVTVHVNATATGPYCSGAYAVGGTITVEGDVISDGQGSNGVSVMEGGTAAINGSAVAEGEYSYGAKAYSANGERSSVKVAVNATAAGYMTYGAYADGENSSVEVGQSARTDGEGSYGVYALNGGTIAVDENVTAEGNRSCGAYAGGEGSLVNVGQSATAAGDDCYGALALGSSTIMVDADVTATGDINNIGAYTEGGTITVGGDAAGEGDNSRGAYAAGGTITIGDDAAAEGGDSRGAMVGEGGTITVGGNAVADGEYSIGAVAIDSGSYIEVAQTASATGERSSGATAASSGVCKVYGDAAGNGPYSSGVTSEYGGEVIVAGNTASYGEYCYGVYIYDGGEATLGANVTSDGLFSVGVRILDGGTATVRGNVTASGNSSYGINVSGGGAATVEGVIAASLYVLVDNVGKYAQNGIRGTSPYEDYLIYSKNASVVRVRIQVSLTITTAMLTAATTGMPYSRTVAVDYTGRGALVYSAAGLPNGLSIDPGTGIISGTPEAGTETGSPYGITVDVTDGALSDSASLSLVVRAGAKTPVINTQPADTLKNIGEKATFTVAAAAPDGGSLSYRWQKSVNGGTVWNNIMGATGASYTTGTLAFADNGTKYRCVITNSKNGTTAAANSDEATLTVNPPATAPTINTQPANITGNIGETATFAVAAAAPDGGSLTYLWQKSVNGGAAWDSIPGATGASYTTDTLAFADNGTKYRCVITNSKNGTTATAGSDEATLTVNPAAAGTLSITTVALPGARVGTAYNRTIECDYTGGGTLEFSAAGLPGGLSVNTGTGVISGMPNAGTDKESPYSVTVVVTDGTLTDSRSLSLTVDAAATIYKTLVSVTTPASIAGVPNGTAKTASALGLPARVRLITNDGEVQADVDWDTGSCSYDPNDAHEQAFTVGGAVILPAGVVNTNNVDLDVTVSVTVDAAAAVHQTLISITTPAAITGVANGAEKTAAGLGLPSTVILVTDNGNVVAGVTWDVASSGYNQSSRSAQTFLVSGTAALPAGVVNTNDVSLTTAVGVSVKEASAGSTNHGHDDPAAPSFKAVIHGSDASGITLPVSVDADAGSAAVKLGFLAETIFASKDTPVLNMPAIDGVDAYTLGIPARSLSVSQAEGALTFSTAAGSITIPDGMLAGVAGAEGKEAGITIGRVDKSMLPSGVKQTQGDRPLVQLTLTVDGIQVEWNNPDRPVTVAIPYTPTPAELSDPEHIVVWYIGGSGNIASVPGARYDRQTGTVSFTTAHFSFYAVAFVHRTFVDLDGAAWAKKPVEVLASQGVLKDTQEKEYLPFADITRAEFLYSLVRALGVDARIDVNFKDIAADAYYYREIGIAKKLGITGGVGNNKFNPNAGITRQDMMVMTEKALRVLKKLEAQGAPTELDRFADRTLVAAYAVNSAATMIKEGLITGSGGRLNPLGGATRAEAAVILYKLYNRYQWDR